MDIETEDVSSEVEEISQSQSIYYPSDDSESSQASPDDESQVQFLIYYSAQ